MGIKRINVVAVFVWLGLTLWIGDTRSWQVFVGGGFVLFFAVRWRELDTLRTLTITQRWVHQGAGVVFPVFSTALKSWMVHQGMTDEAGYGNRFQHASWAMALTCVMLPMFVRWWRSMDFIDAAVIAIGIVVAVGVGVEMVEAVRKIGAPVGYQAHAFRDTMRDLAMNLAGATGGFALVWWSIASRRRRDSLVRSAITSQ